MQYVAQAEVDRHGASLESGLLPGAVLEIADVLRKPAHRRHHQRPGEFGRRDRRARAFSNRDAPLGASLHVDVASDTAGLHHQFELWQLLDQRSGKVGAFANQHDDVRILEPDRKLPDALDSVGVDLGRERLELVCTS